MFTRFYSSRQFYRNFLLWLQGEYQVGLRRGHLGNSAGTRTLVGRCLCSLDLVFASVIHFSDRPAFESLRRKTTHYWSAAQVKQMVELISYGKRVDAVVMLFRRIVDEMEVGPLPPHIGIGWGPLPPSMYS